ncbi:Na-translocating system protein MpsC family protein [Desertibacillus haloalkaliphilus]|uniref:Na-translocating system protein MpsC family protein n=1 Tax=Desertibacillus haloalkaliphilus TaxID=1328930 RepID=UPI001C254B9B|nr:Na-translocating system protein MpsC family protein [Desertibacillus haloalkaliphilus]MBU8905312.1 DUF2294 domain-containing protein [Desertibacillus haloalkaliphilus]
MELQDQVNYISSYTSKLLRRNFGRGPESCQATFGKSHFVLYIRGFISPMEEVLLQQGQSDYVDTARSVVIGHLLEELKGVVQVTLDVEVGDYYHDWNFPNNSGMIILVLKEIETEQMTETDLNISQRLELETARISQLVQKAPENLSTYPLSQKLYLVERKGILVPIEKALISKGYTKELIVTKDELEKSYFHRYGKFEEIFKKQISDIFIDWNIKEDKSLVGFVLK